MKSIPSRRFLCSYASGFASLWWKLTQKLYFEGLIVTEENKNEIVM